MLDCSNSAVDYSELALMQLWLSEQGWVADRAQLSETTQNELKCLFKNQLSDQQFNHLMGSLKLAFSNAVELTERHLELRNIINQAVQQQGRKKRPPRKLGTILRDYVRILLKVLDDAQTGTKSVQLEDLVADIRRFKVLENLVNLELEDRLKDCTIDPLREVSARIAEQIPDVLFEVERGLNRAVISGGIDPGSQYLAKSFVSSFYSVTGSPPGRVVDAYAVHASESETSLGLRACKILAEALNEARPLETKRNSPIGMTKPYRTACKELKEELASGR